MEAGNKVWTEETITALLSSNNKAVERAILAIYNRQTQDEKACQTTRHSNSVGFSGADAATGSYYAQWVKRGNRLTGKHLDRARKMAIKYRKQLLTIAQSSAQKNTPEVVSEPSQTENRILGACDLCSHKTMGREYSHNGTPVLLLCDACIPTG